MKGKEIAESLRKLYVPVGKRAKFESLMEEIEKTPLRDPNEKDAGRKGVPVLLVYVKGNGSRSSFDFACWHEADFAEMGPKMGIACVRLNGNENHVIPVRFAYKTHHILTTL